MPFKAQRFPLSEQYVLPMRILHCFMLEWCLNRQSKLHIHQAWVLQEKKFLRVSQCLTSYPNSSQTETRVKIPHFQMRPCLNQTKTCFTITYLDYHLMCCLSSTWWADMDIICHPSSDWQHQIMFFLFFLWQRQGFEQLLPERSSHGLFTYPSEQNIQAPVQTPSGVPDYHRLLKRTHCCCFGGGGGGGKGGGGKNFGGGGGAPKHFPGGGGHFGGKPHGGSPGGGFPGGGKPHGGSPGGGFPGGGNPHGGSPGGVFPGGGKPYQGKPFGGGSSIFMDVVLLQILHVIELFYSHRILTKKPCKPQKASIMSKVTCWYICLLSGGSNKQPGGGQKSGQPGFSGAPGLPGFSGVCFTCLVYTCEWCYLQLFDLNAELQKIVDW